MTRLVIELPAEVHALLRHQSFDAHRSMGAVVADLITEAFAPLPVRTVRRPMPMEVGDRMAPAPEKLEPRLGAILHFRPAPKVPAKR